MRGGGHGGEPDTESEIERVGFFVDGPNLHKTSQRLGLRIDYAPLLRLVRSLGAVIYAGYYTGLPSLSEESQERRRIPWLERNGYLPVLRVGKQVRDDDGIVRCKADMDVRIAVDMMEMAFAGRIDRAVLASGDGDFRPAVAAIQRRGVAVTVISSRHGDQPSAAIELLDQADDFIDLHDVAASIKWRPSRFGRAAAIQAAAGPAGQAAEHGPP